MARVTSGTTTIRSKAQAARDNAEAVVETDRQREAMAWWTMDRLLYALEHAPHDHEFSRAMCRLWRALDDLYEASPDDNGAVDGSDVVCALDAAKTAAGISIEERYVEIL